MTSFFAPETTTPEQSKSSAQSAPYARTGRHNRKRTRRADVRHINRPPTEGQRRVLLAIQKLTAQHGWSPTLKELCRALGFKSTNGAADHLFRLECKGLIERSRNRGVARTLRLSPAGRLEIGITAAGPKTPGVYRPVTICVACATAFVAGLACWGCKRKENAA